MIIREGRRGPLTVAMIGGDVRDVGKNDRGSVLQITDQFICEVFETIEFVVQNYGVV